MTSIAVVGFLLLALSIQDIAEGACNITEKSRITRLWLEGEFKLKDKCTQTMVCNSGQWVQGASYSCPSGTKCITHIKANPLDNWDECIDKNTCTNPSGSHVWKEGDYWITDKCTQKMYCKKGQWQPKQNFKCSDVYDSDMKCVTRNETNNLLDNYDLCVDSLSCSTPSGTRIFMDKEKWIKNGCKEYLYCHYGELLQVTIPYNCPKGTKCHTFSEISDPDNWDECLPSDRCPSKMSSLQFKVGDPWLMDDCTHRMDCIKGEWHLNPSPFKCPIGTKCLMDKQHFDVVNAGYCKDIICKNPSGSREFKHGSFWIKDNCTQRIECKEGQWNQATRYSCSNGKKCFTHIEPDSRDNWGECIDINCKSPSGRHELKPGSIWINDNCTRRFECKEGQWTARQFSCSNDQKCYTRQALDPSDNRGECIDKNICISGSSFFNDGDYLLKDKCTKKRVCKNGVWESGTPYSCPFGTKCVNQGGRDQCEKLKCLFPSSRLPIWTSGWFYHDKCTRKKECKHGKWVSAPAAKGCGEGLTCVTNYEKDPQNNWDHCLPDDKCFDSSRRQYRGEGQRIWKDNCTKEFVCLDKQWIQNPKKYNCGSGKKCTSITTFNPLDKWEECTVLYGCYTPNWRYYAHGSFWIKDNCTVRMECQEGLWKTDTSYSCPDGTKCFTHIDPEKWDECIASPTTSTKKCKHH